MLEVADPVAACEDADLADAVKLAKAELAKVDAEKVEVACSVVPEDARRLGIGSRRLAGSVEFSYRIAVDSAEAASTMAAKISEEEVDDFAALIVENLPEGSSYDIKVLSMSATAITVTKTTTTTTTEGEELDDSHAHSPAALGSTALAVIAAALVLSH